MAITFVAATTGLTATTETATTISATLPSTTVGDVVFAWINVTDSGAVNPALTAQDASWILLGTSADSGTPTPYSSLWYRVVQTSDDTTPTWTSTGGVTFMGAMVMSAYRGVDTTAPVMQQAFDVIGATSTARTTATIVTTATTWVVSGFSDKTAGVDHTSPSGTIRGQARQLTNGLPCVMLQDTNGTVSAGSNSMTAVASSTSVGNSFILSLLAAVHTSLMPGGGVDLFTGTTGTSAAGTNWVIATNEGTGGSWTYQSGQGRLRTGTAANNRTSVRINRADLADGEALFDFVVPASSTMYPAFYARAGTSINGDGGYYFLFNHGASGMMEFGKWVPNYNGVPLSDISYTFTPGVIMRVRIAIFGSRIRMRMWPAANSEVTTSWDMDFTDSGTQPTTGRWGFTNAAQSAGSKDWFLDNVDLFDIITPSQATVTVGGSITATGNMVKQVPKIFTASITAAGAFAKLKVVPKLLTGSITAAGAFRKSTTKTLTGSITGAGAFKKNATKRFTASVTAAGAFKKNATRKFAGTITPAGSAVVVFVGRIFGYPGILIMKIFKPGDLRIRFRRG